MDLIPKNKDKEPVHFLIIHLLLVASNYLYPYGWMQTVLNAIKICLANGAA